MPLPHFFFRGSSLLPLSYRPNQGLLDLTLGPLLTSWGWLYLQRGAGKDNMVLWMVQDAGSSVPFGKLWLLPEPQFPHLQKGGNGL